MAIYYAKLDKDNRITDYADPGFPQEGPGWVSVDVPQEFSFQEDKDIWHVENGRLVPDDAKNSLAEAQKGIKNTSIILSELTKNSVQGIVKSEANSLLAAELTAQLASVQTAGASQDQKLDTLTRLVATLTKQLVASNALNTNTTEENTGK